MNTYRFTLFNLALDGAYPITTSSFEEQTFDPARYSWFKYGAGKAAQQYAAALARGVAQMLVLGSPVYVTGSAYAKVPTAAVPLARWTARKLSDAGCSTGYFHLVRPAFVGDYGASTFAMRTRMLADSQPYIQTPQMRRHLQGVQAVIIDDIRITGKHEECLVPILQNAGVATAIFCYIAIIDQADGERDPLIEDRLNHAAVKTPLDLISIASQRPFYCNARTCKFILSADSALMEQLIAELPLLVLERFKRAMQADGYNTLADYQKAFVLFARLIARRRAGS